MISALWPCYCGSAVAGMAVFGLVFPAATTLVIGATGADRCGMAFGLFYAIYSLGVVVGASGSGRLAELRDNVAILPLIGVMRHARPRLGH